MKELDHELKQTDIDVITVNKKKKTIISYDVIVSVGVIVDRNIKTCSTLEKHELLKKAEKSAKRYIKKEVLK